MDGTLLNSDKNISDRTKATIMKAKEQGKRVVLATGRPKKGIDRYIKELDLFDDKDYVVTYNGALVQNTVSGDIIMNVPLNKQAYEELYDLSLMLNVGIHALSSNYVTTPKNNKYTGIESSLNGIDIIEKPVSQVDGNELIVKVMFVDHPETIERVIRLLPDWVYEKYTVVRSAPFFLEFLDPSVNKGFGVDAVAKQLGLSSESVICVGDAGNDLAMIEYAALGVAMENASEDVKRVANYVTHSNNDDGVAHIIEKFML